MKQHTNNVKTAAVLGAGVMGAQIAAHLVNANIKTYLFDLSEPSNPSHSIAEHSIKALKKLKPNPLGDTAELVAIEPANYDEHLEHLEKCDFIIEAISERLDYKQALYEKVAPHINKDAIFASNTSGLSIEALAKFLPQELQERFVGVHFFNPPRYMKLVEIIGHAKTQQSYIEEVETFLVHRLGKGVVEAKDTPNFIGNRIGVFSMLAIMQHADTYKIPPDLVDALTGPLIGRAKSATFRTMDVVGLDTMLHVINTIQEGLPNDPWVKYFKAPKWLTTLVDKGAFGQKTKAGVFKKVKGKIQVLDTTEGSYRPINAQVAPEVAAIFKQAPDQQLIALRNCTNPQAQFLWSIYRDLFHYCAFHLTDIAQNVADVDKAIRWGFGWKQGPFESWQLNGFKAILEAVNEDIQNNKALGDQAMPAWCQTANALYTEQGFFNPHTKQYDGTKPLAVYNKQRRPERMLMQKDNLGTTLLDEKAYRLWTLDNEVAIFSFKTKMNSISSDVLDGITHCIKLAEDKYEALVLFPENGPNFSVGADLRMFLQAQESGDFETLEREVRKFQQCALALRDSKVPTVAALKGLTLGGGCELALHATSRVVAFETYMGLPEVGVGILPAGGGTKELAKRIAKGAIKGDLRPALEKFYTHIAMPKISSSAKDAKEMGLLTDGDRIIMNSDEILHCALSQAKALAQSGYCPPLNTPFAVAGEEGMALLHTQLVNMREGQFISDHDYHILSKIAQVICGSTLAYGTKVDESWLLELEINHFIDLAKTDLSKARVRHMLETGKPLRN